jgi:hypothetical protein
MHNKDIIILSGIMNDMLDNISDTNKFGLFVNSLYKCYKFTILSKSTLAMYATTVSEDDTIHGELLDFYLDATLTLGTIAVDKLLRDGIEAYEATVSGGKKNEDIRDSLVFNNDVTHDVFQNSINKAILLIRYYVILNTGEQK